MAEPISIQQLKDASEDAITLADFIYKPANVMIPRRLAADINSLQYYLDYMSSYAQHSYETYDEMVANVSNLSENVSVFVTNDLDTSKNGIYTYNGTSFVKGDYQPENVAKEFVEARLGGLEVFDGKVRAQDVSVEPIISGATSMTQLDKNREHVSISDFFTADEAASYAENWGALDASRAIQEFFEYIAVNNVGIADASGDYSIHSGLELNGMFRGAQSIATTTIMGSLRLWARNAIDTMLKIYNCSELRWLGNVQVIGYATGMSYTSRTCRLGVHISRSNGAQFGGFKCDYFRSFGISLDDSIGNTSHMSLGKVFCRVCGSGAINASLVANYSAREDTTVAGVPSLARSKLKVDVLPIPEDITGNNRSQYFMHMAGKTYRIMETDYENSIVSVYPIIAENTDQTGTFDYMFGGAVNIRGSDSGIQSFDTIAAHNCGIVVDMCSLYGPEITSIVAESNGIALAVGLNIDSAMVSYNIAGFYTEYNRCDIFQHTGAASDGGYFIGAEYALNLAKIEGSMRLYGIMKNGRLLNYEKRPNNEDEVYQIEISIDRPNIVRTFRKEFASADRNGVRITPVNENFNRLFGYDSATLILQGSGEGGTPTGPFTFESSDPTWTVNGSTTPITMQDFQGTAVVSIYCHMATKDIKVTLVNPPARKQTQSVAETTVLENSKFEQTVSLTGASLGNWVQAAYTQPTAGLLTNAYVSAANVVTVEFINPTASPITLAAGSIKIKLTKL